MMITLDGKRITLQGAIIQIGDILQPHELAALAQGDLLLIEEGKGVLRPQDLLQDGGAYHLLEPKLALLRLLPSVDKLLSHPILASLDEAQRRANVREVLERMRKRILAGEHILPQWSELAQAAHDMRDAPIPHNPLREQLQQLNAIILDNPFESLRKVLTGLGDNGRIALARQQLGQHGDKRVEDYILSAGWSVLPLGTANRCRIDDFLALGEGEASAWSWLAQEGFALKGFVAMPSPLEVAEVAQSVLIPCLVYLGEESIK